MAELWRTQVIIIGAGLSGLCAAKVLSEKGIEVIILESQSKVGGRTQTIRNDAIGWTDTGGSFIAPSQVQINRLAKELNAPCFEAQEDLKYICFHHGRRFVHGKDWTKFSLWNPLGWFDINYVMDKMNKMMELIPENEPWNCPFAKEWDDMSLYVFLERECWTRHALQFLLSLFEASVSVHSAHVSLLWWLWYSKCCGGSKKLWDASNKVQTKKFLHGSMTLCDLIAERLDDKLKLNSAVSEIIQDDDEITVTTVNNIMYKAEYAIMAIPPSAQQKIYYQPPIPHLRDEVIQRTVISAGIQATIYYNTPFWRNKGYNGLVTCRDGQLVLKYAVDDCHPGSELAALTVYIAPDYVIRLQELTKEERLNEIVKDLAKAYRTDEAIHPVHYDEKNWMKEENSGGSCLSPLPLGVISRYGNVIREPFERIYYAGTESATSWPGFMNGAVQAGERAAREVMHALDVIPESSVWVNEVEEEKDSMQVTSGNFLKDYLEKKPPAVGTILSLSAFSSLIVGTAFFATMMYFKIKK